MGPVRTPDGRYLVIYGKSGPRLWRASNPNLSESERQTLVDDLMAARRAIRIYHDDPSALAKARADVHWAKCGLGERGPPWWSDETADVNRTLVKNSSYREWWQARLSKSGRS